MNEISCMYTCIHKYIYVCAWRHRYVLIVMCINTFTCMCILVSVCVYIHTSLIYSEIVDNEKGRPFRRVRRSAPPKMSEKCRKRNIFFGPIFFFAPNFLFFLGPIYIPRLRFGKN